MKHFAISVLASLTMILPCYGSAHIDKNDKLINKRLQDISVHLQKKVSSDDTIFIYDQDISGNTRTYVSDMLVADEIMGSLFFNPGDGFVVYVCWGDDGKTAWIKNLSTMGNVWVKGDIVGDTIEIDTAQPIMKDFQGVVWRLCFGYFNNNENVFTPVDKASFKFNEDRSFLELVDDSDENSKLVSFTMDPESGDLIQGFAGIRLTELNDEAVTVPQDATMQRYHYTAMFDGSMEWDNMVWIATKDTDAYIQGMEWIYPHGYVKGKVLSNGNISIPSGQYLGLNGGYPSYYNFSDISDFDEYGYPTNVTDAPEIIIERTENGGYKMPHNTCLNVGFYVIDGKWTPYELIPDTPLSPTDLTWNDSKAVLTFRMPNASATNDFLDAGMLSYTIFVDGEPMMFLASETPAIEDWIELPYDFSSYDLQRSVRFGRGEDNVFSIPMPEDRKYDLIEIQCYYTVNGDRRASDLASIHVDYEPLEYVGSPEGNIKIYEEDSSMFMLRAPFEGGGYQLGKSSSLIYEVCYSDDGRKVWFSGMCPYTDGWIETKFDGKTATFRSGQPMSKNGVPMTAYAVQVDTDYGDIRKLDKIEFDYDSESDSWCMRTSGQENVPYMIATFNDEDNTIAWGRSDIVMNVFTDSLFIPESNDNAVEYNFSFTDGDAVTATKASIIFNDNGEIYVGGISDDADGWIKGHVDDEGNWIFASGQFVGMTGGYPARLWFGQDASDNGNISISDSGTIKFVKTEDYVFRASGTDSMMMGPKDTFGFWIVSDMSFGQTPQGIEEVTDVCKRCRYYTVSGLEVDGDTPGLLIERNDNGKTRKIINR